LIKRSKFLLLYLMLITFIVLLFAGMPVAFAMAIGGTLAILGLKEVAPILVPQKLVLSLNSFPLMAIPFFILAGELMNTGGITRRVVGLSKALMGHVPGSLAQVNILTSIILSGFSGSATADATAVGSVLIPAMKEEGYSSEFSAGVTAASACIGPIIPPSIIMVIYGAITGISIGKLFMGGLIPGVMIGACQMAVVFIYAKKYNMPRGEKHTIGQIAKTFREAVWAILAPMIILGGIVTGVTTATEAGVVACVYAFIIGFFVYREITVRQIPKILVDAAENTAVPVIIIAGASIVGFVLARQNFAIAVARTLNDMTSSPSMSYLLIICMLLIVGLFVEGTAALMIFTPVLFPIGNHLGYDPIHFALVVIIVILIGTTTPPVGLQLYIAGSIAKVQITRVVIWPFVGIMVGVVLLVVYVPTMVTYLPSVLFK
jgi:tripartite ATP-independent transporter DctM subunit